MAKAKSMGANTSTLRALRGKDMFTVVFHTNPGGHNLSKVYRVTTHRPDGTLRYKDISNGDIFEFNPTMTSTPSSWKLVLACVALTESRELRVGPVEDVASGDATASA